VFDGHVRVGRLVRGPRRHRVQSVDAFSRHVAAVFVVCQEQSFQRPIISFIFTHQAPTLEL
jgi:hypothetical protein